MKYFDIKNLYNPVEMFNNFYNIIDTLFIKMNLLDVNAWVALLTLYVAPIMLIYWLVKSFLEEIGLFDKYAKEISAMIALIALPPGTYIVAWLVANFTAIGVVSLFGVLVLLGISNYYKRKMAEYNYILGSETITSLIAHLPMLMGFAIAGGASTFIIRSPSFWADASYVVVIVFVVLTVIKVALYYSKYKGDIRKNLGAFPIEIVIIGVAIFIIRSYTWLLSPNIATIIQGALVGFSIGYMLVALERSRIPTQKKLESIEDRMKDLLSRLEEEERALSLIDSLISNISDKQRLKYTYVNLSDEDKRILNRRGIGGNNIETVSLEYLRERREDVKKTIDLLNSNLSALQRMELETLLSD